MKKLTLSVVAILATVFSFNASAQKDWSFGAAASGIIASGSYRTNIYEATGLAMYNFTKCFHLGVGAGVGYAEPMVLYVSPRDLPDGVEPLHEADEHMKGAVLPVFVKMKVDFAPKPSHLFLALRAGTRVCNFKYHDDVFNIIPDDNFWPLMFDMAPSVGYELGLGKHSLALEVGSDINLTQYVKVNTSYIKTPVKTTVIYGSHEVNYKAWPGLYASLSFMF